MSGRTVSLTSGVGEVVAEQFGNLCDRPADLPDRCPPGATIGAWLHTYNHHRGHTALGGLPPAARVPNLTGQNT
jgi:hypothetical protein